MSFLKRRPTVVCAEDVAMAERLQTVRSRGKRETTVYETWQVSEPIRRSQRRSSTVEA